MAYLLTYLLTIAYQAEHRRRACSSSCPRRFQRRVVPDVVCSRATQAVHRCPVTT